MPDGQIVIINGRRQIALLGIDRRMNDGAVPAVVLADSGRLHSESLLQSGPLFARRSSPNCGRSEKLFRRWTE